MTPGAAPASPPGTAAVAHRRPARVGLFVVALLFLLSGVSALVYEIAWTRIAFSRSVLLGIVPRRTHSPPR